MAMKSNENCLLCNTFQTIYQSVTCHVLEFDFPSILSEPCAHCRATNESYCVEREMLANRGGRSQIVTTITQNTLYVVFFFG